MLEVLQKAVLGVQMGWGGWPLKRNDTLGIYLGLPPKHVLWSIERQATLYCVLCRRSQGTENHAMWQIHPLSHLIPPKVACAGLSQSYQISVRLVQKFWSPRL